jgi:hypothetical protein
MRVPGIAKALGEMLVLAAFQHEQVKTTKGNKPKEAVMRYKPKSVTALHIALGGLPDEMRVEVDPDIGMAVGTGGNLRKLTTWPDNLAVNTPLDRFRKAQLR